MSPVPVEPEGEAQKGQSDSTRTMQLSSGRAQSHPGSELPDGHAQWCSLLTQPVVACVMSASALLLPSLCEFLPLGLIFSNSYLSPALISGYEDRFALPCPLWP